jgi:hypothetical protein
VGGGSLLSRSLRLARRYLRLGLEMFACAAPLRDTVTAMKEHRAISHGEALELLDAQIGQRVYVGFLVPRAQADHHEGPAPFVHTVGTLTNPLLPKPPRLEPDIGFYELGTEMLQLPPMAGSIHLRDDGIDFRLGAGVSIRTAWRGSPEVGDPWTNPVDLGRLFAHGRRAPAEILEAAPTDRKIGAGENERRIWDLKVRVHPEGEPAFETEAQHHFRRSPNFETLIERGEFLRLIPHEKVEVEALYDPDDHRQIIVRPVTTVRRAFAWRASSADRSTSGHPQEILPRGRPRGSLRLRARACVACRIATD